MAQNILGMSSNRITRRHSYEKEVYCGGLGALVVAGTCGCGLADFTVNKFVIDGFGSSGNPVEVTAGANASVTVQFEGAGNLRDVEEPGQRTMSLPQTITIETSGSVSFVGTQSWTFMQTNGPQSASFNLTVFVNSGVEAGQYSVDLLSEITWGEALANNIKSATVYIRVSAPKPPDTTPPVTTARPDPVMPDGGAGWYKSPVTVTLEAHDDDSGVGATYLNDEPYTSPVTFSEDGVHTVTYYSVDNAGNAEDVKSVTFRIDKTAPTTSATLEPMEPDGGDGWYNSPVRVTLHAEDDGSGVAETFYRVDRGSLVSGKSVTLETDAVHIVSFYSVDVAGNAETPKTVKVMIDTIAPTTSAALHPDSPDGLNGWYRQQVTVNFTATDEGSGVKATYSSVDGGAEEQGNSVVVSTDGIHTVTFYSVDYANNKEDPGSVSFNIDMTPPTTKADLVPASPSAGGGLVQLAGHRKPHRIRRHVGRGQHLLRS